MYSLIIKTRQWLYQKNILPRTRLNCPVISVGNLTCGGTGKTPLVIFLANYLFKQGKRVVVLLRGYKGRASAQVKLVSDGEMIYYQAREVGDEAILLAYSLPGIPIIAGKKRVISGALAIERFQPEVILLDDGFQHLALKRDLDLVVIDGLCPFSNRRLLPWGRLREPINNLSRADGLILNRVNQINQSQKDSILKELSQIRGDIPILETSYQVKEIINFNTRQAQDLSSFQGKRAFLFSGIGQPSSFRKTVEGLGMRVMEQLNFRDHHFFTSRDLQLIKSRFLKSGAELILSTEKDAIRLERGILHSYYFIKIKLRFEKGIDKLDVLVNKLFSK